MIFNNQISSIYPSLSDIFRKVECLKLINDLDPITNYTRDSLFLNILGYFPNLKTPLFDGIFNLSRYLLNNYNKNVSHKYLLNLYSYYISTQSLANIIIACQNIRRLYDHSYRDMSDEIVEKFG